MLRKPRCLTLLVLCFIAGHAWAQATMKNADGSTSQAVGIGALDANGNGHLASPSNPIPFISSGTRAFIALASTQTLTVTSSAQGLIVPAGATVASISLTGGNVLYRDDGIAPTGSVGLILYAGTSPYTYTGPLSAIQFILPTGGASAMLTVGFYK